MRLLLTASFCVLALTACNRGDTAANTAPATSGGGDRASSDGGGGDGGERADRTPSPFPALRAGLWQVTTTRTPARQGGRGARGPTELCTDGTTPARVGGMRRGGECAPNVTRNADGSMAFTSDCDTPFGAHITTRGTFTGDGQTSYRVHLETLMSGASREEMNGARTTDITGRYMGACPAGMNPGDMRINGQVVTREQMRAMRRGMGGGGGGMGGGTGGGMGGGE
jgi:hypothetical protein